MWSCVGLASVQHPSHGKFGEIALHPSMISTERYKSMDAAYEAGQARLSEFIPSKKSRWSEMDDFDEPVLDHGSEMCVSM